MHMAQVETWIRERAYAIWEMEGRPQGCERRHWEQATRDVMARGKGSAEPPAGSSQKAAAKAASAKPRSGRTRKAA